MNASSHMSVYNIHHHYEPLQQSLGSQKGGLHGEAGDKQITTKRNWSSVEAKAAEWLRWSRWL